MMGKGFSKRVGAMPSSLRTMHVYPRPTYMIYICDLSFIQLPFNARGSALPKKTFSFHE